MGTITIRQFSAKFGQRLAAGALAGWLGGALAQGNGRVVIIRGGAGGPTAAHYVKDGRPSSKSPQKDGRE